MVFIYFLKVSTANGNQEITHNVQIRRKLKCIFFSFFSFCGKANVSCQAASFLIWKRVVACLIWEMDPRHEEGQIPVAAAVNVPADLSRGGKENQDKLNQKHVLLVSGKLEACREKSLFCQSCYSEAKIGGGGR